MTFDQYMHEANLYFLKHKEDLRYGQALMNYLNEVSRLAYLRIPQDCDPFYDNDIVPFFLNYLMNNWDELTRPLHAEVK